MTASPGKYNTEVQKTLAILGGLCLFLSTIEYMIPKPLPFMRIGLANLPLMLAINLFPFHIFLLLTAVKIFGQALISGTLFSYVFLFSFTGTALSAVIMYALNKLGKNYISLIGIGTAGAMVSNTAQLTLASVFLFGNVTRFMAPPFLAAGLITGAFLGFICEFFIRRSAWYAKARASIKYE